MIFPTDYTHYDDIYYWLYTLDDIYYWLHTRMIFTTGYTLG